MTGVPLGKSAYKREYGGTAEVKLLNRWLEANPSNYREGTSVLARPGTTQLLSLNPGSFVGFGAMRGVYFLSGLFNEALFVVCGSNLYRIDQDMTVTHIQGVISGTGCPEVGWQKGAGYEQMWISDGLVLQYYGGTTSAKGTLTNTGSIVNGVDKFEIGGVFYTWGTTFSGSDAGTSANPYVVDPTQSIGSVSNPLAQLVLAITDTGTPGVDYSSTISQPNQTVTATNSSTGIISVTVTNGGSGYTSTPTVSVVGGTGSGFSATATLSSGSVSTITVTHSGDGYSVPDSNGIGGPNLIISGGGGSGATGTANVGTPTPTQVVDISASQPGSAGNSITFTVTGGSALTTSGSGTLINGGLDALLGCPLPVGLVPLTVTQVSSYLLVGIANSQQFYWVNPGETTIDPLNFASKESSPDNIVTMRTVGDQVLILGERSTENWYATGNSLAPFAPIEGRVYARGVIPSTAVVVDDGVVIVGDDGRVYNIGYGYGDNTDAQYGVTRVSNNGIEERIRFQIRREAGLTP